MQAPTLRSGTSVSRHLALAGVFGPPLFVAVFTVGGWMRPGYSSLRQEVSALGVGATSWLQNTNFVVFGLLLVLFAFAFADGMRGALNRRWRSAMLTLLLLSGTGMILSGVFPMSPSTVVVHWVGGFVLAILPSIVVSFLASVVLGRNHDWRTEAKYSLTVGITALALIATTFVFLNPAFPGLNQFGGLIQRLLVAVVFSWHVVFGWQLWRKTGSDLRTADGG